MINNYKQATRIAAISLKNVGNLFLSRGYATNISDYKITWTRPEKVSNLSPERSGDQGLEIKIESTDIYSAYNESPELKDASDIVKKMFTLQFLPRKKSVAVKRNKILELVKRHELDNASPEARIALMTSKIYQLQDAVANNPKNSLIRVALKETIDKRKKQLKYLRMWDYRRFEWILEKLNLVYKPQPELPLQITRKDSLRRLTERHCNKLVQGKLNVYKRELKELQKDFYMEKAQKLAFIREEELACRLNPSVSKEDITNAEQKAREYQT